MDTYEISDANEPPRRKRTNAMVWNVLTIFVLVIILCVISVLYLIFIFPNSSINPFPPPTLYPSMAAPTFTVTPRITLVPSWTPTREIPQATNVPGPTHTPLITNAPTANIAVEEPTATLAPGGFTFVAQQGSPSAISGEVFHPDAGCTWSGVAGQATSLNGEAVKGLFVQLGGSTPGVEYVDKLTMTGLAAQYGPGGFEFTLANDLVSSEGTLWIQLMDQQNMLLSDRVYFSTYDDCQKNLVIIYFEQVR